MTVIIDEDEDLCGSCGQAEPNDDCYHPDFGDVCAACFDAYSAEDARDAFAAGDPFEARDLLMGLAPASVDVCAELIRNAQDCARRDDWDGAAHQLRLLIEPKWSSEAECRAQYDAAMERAAL